MKMKQISTLSALVTMMFSATAFADVTLYGNMQANVEKARHEKVEANSNGSYIGFKGKEVLSSNTNAIWQYEQGVEVGSTESNTLTSKEKSFKDDIRDSYVGLENATVGKITVGKQTLPYSATVNQLDQHVDKSISNRQFFGGETQKRNVGSVMYETPNLYGASASVAYAAETQDGLDERMRTVSSAIKYKIAGVEAAVAHEQQRNSLADNDRRDSFAATGSYKIAGLNTKVGAGYEHTQYRDQARLNKVKQDAATINVETGITPNVDLTATYTHLFDNKTNNVKQKDSNANIYTAGVNYNLSPRTTLGSYYSYIDNKANSSHTFGNSDGVANKNQYGYGLTMSHKF